MKGDEQINRALIAAIVTVLQEESVGVSIIPSQGREKGKVWSIDHRRVSVGRRSVIQSRSERSTTR
jgi:hypothetical protein